jgi:rod shape-determining protein MreC
MSLISRSRKRLLIVVVLILAAVVLMPIYRQNHGIPGILKQLSYPYDALNGLTSSLSADISDVMNAADENKRLKSELRNSLAERQRYGEIIGENRRLHELLELRNQIQGSGTAARVIGRGYDKFINTLVIDKGRNEGIIKDMSAITPKGLAGKVSAVRSDYAEVMLLTDPNFSVAVRLQEGRHEGVLAGTGHRYCILKYVPTENPVKEGEIVVTSGLDGIFPQGVPVGKVVKVRTEGVEFFQYIEVMPFQSSSKIEEVVVIGRSAEIRKPPMAADHSVAPVKGEQ